MVITTFTRVPETAGILNALQLCRIGNYQQNFNFPADQCHQVHFDKLWYCPNWWYCNQQSSPWMKTVMRPHMCKSHMIKIQSQVWVTVHWPLTHEPWGRSINFRHYSSGSTNSCKWRAVFCTRMCLLSLIHKPGCIHVPEMFFTTVLNPNNKNRKKWWILKRWRCSRWHKPFKLHTQLKSYHTIFM